MSNNSSAAFTIAWLALMANCTDCYGTAKRAARDEARSAVRSMVKEECRR